MREKEFKAVFDGEKYVMPQDMSYRVKNRISEKTMFKTAKPFFKRSASAMLSIILASVLVITAAAVGGVMLFKSIYGDNIEPIMPYSEQINLTAADQNYELTLHEAVADEYTTAYIFSVKRLTVGASEAESKNASDMIFKGMGQCNRYDGTCAVKDLSQPYGFRVSYFFNDYELRQIQLYETYLDSRIKLIRADANFEDENYANYIIRTIDDLETTDTDYYALYVINGEDQVLSIGVGTDKGPELTLPKVARKAPSVTRSVQEYYRQYLKQADPILLYNGGKLADVVTVTPLAVYTKSTGALSSSGRNSYVSIDYISGSFYRSASLVMIDGAKKYLTELSQDEVGIRISANTGVYLFDEVLDTSMIKSFMVYDTVEFPMDSTLPVIDRETGTEIVPKYEVMDLVFEFGNELADYLDAVYPYPGEREQGKNYRASPRYRSENTCTIGERDCDITLTGYELNGETFSDAANRLLEEYRTKYSWTVSEMTTKDGTCALGDVKYAEINYKILDGNAGKMHFFFFEKDGKLMMLQLSERTNMQPYYSLDALLQLITFN